MQRMSNMALREITGLNLKAQIQQRLMIVFIMITCENTPELLRHYSLQNNAIEIIIGSTQYIQ